MKILLYNSLVVLKLFKKFFFCKFNKILIHQVITCYISKKYQCTNFQKNRSEVSGSNKKPWRQKGTGRARAGSLKSPIWRSGGVTFNSNFENNNFKINKKMYRNALKMIFSELFRQNRLIIIKKIIIKSNKSNLFFKKIKKLISNEILIIIDDFNENLFLSSRNIFNIVVCNINNLNLINLIKFNNIITTISVINKLKVS